MALLTSILGSKGLCYGSTQLCSMQELTCASSLVPGFSHKELGDVAVICTSYLCRKFLLVDFFPTTFHTLFLTFSHPSLTPYLHIPHRLPVKRALSLRHWKGHLRCPSEHPSPAPFSLSLTPSSSACVQCKTASQSTLKSPT